MVQVNTHRLRQVEVNRHAPPATLSGQSKSITLTELIATSPTVQVDFLLALPPSTDPAEWQIANWDGYGPVNAQVVVTANQLPSGVCFSLSVDFRPADGPWLCAALGVRYQGQVMFVVTVTPPETCYANQTITLTAQGWCNPVQS